MAPFDLGIAATVALAVLDFVCRFRASVTSGPRTEKRNAIVGGVKNSAHVAGVGYDVVYDVTPPLDEVQVYAHRLGLRVIREDDHDHLQPLDWSPSQTA